MRNGQCTTGSEARPPEQAPFLLPLLALSLLAVAPREPNVLVRRWIEAVLARQPGKEDPRDGRFVERNLGSGHWAFASWLLGEVTPTPALDEFVRLWDRANEPA